MRTIYEDVVNSALVRIVERGITDDAPPQHYGHMYSINMNNGERKEWAILYDGNKCLITSGLEEWTMNEERALLRAGFSF